MKYLIALIAVFALPVFGDSKLTGLTSAESVSTSDLVYISQGGTSKSATIGLVSPRVFSVSGTNAIYTDGNVGIGTSNPTNGLHVGSGGWIQATNMILDAPQWVDLLMNYGYSVTGPSAPSLTATSSNAAIAMLAFDNNDILYAVTQLPHNLARTNGYFQNFYIEPHIHFDVDKYIDTAHTNVTWQLVWQWASINGSFISRTGTNSVTTGIVQGATHYMAEFGHITNNTAGISGVFRCRLMRPASLAQDYSNAHDVFLDGLDLHVPVGNFTIIGSRQDNAQ